MADVMHKRVALVTPVPLGDTLASDHLAGDTVILVDNSSDFDETGGHVIIDGAVYEYTTAEEGEDDDAPPPSITLVAPGLAFDVPADTPVEEWDPALEAIVFDMEVEVTDDYDGSPGTAYLDHDLIASLTEGTPPGVGDSVEVTIDRFGEWHVTNIFGRDQMLDGTKLDPSSIPEATPKTAPLTSPALTVYTGKDFFVLSTPKVASTTWLRFQMSDDAGGSWISFTDMPTRSPIYVVTELPDGSPLELHPADQYRFRVRAENDAGMAGASGYVAADLDTVLRRDTANVVPTTRTLALGDEQKILQTTNDGSTVTITVPTNASVPFPVGTDIEIVQLGTSPVTITADGGVTIESRAGMTDISAQYGSVRLRKRVTNTWVLTGDLA